MGQSPDPRGDSPRGGRGLACLCGGLRLRIVVGVGNNPPTPAASLRVPEERARAAHILSWALTGPVAPRTWRAFGNLLASTAIGALFFVVLALALCVVAPLSLIPRLGVPALSATLRLSARMAEVDRRRIRHFTGTTIAPSALPGPAPDLPRRQRYEAWVQSPAARRLAAYQLARLPISAASLLVMVGPWAGTIALLEGRPDDVTVPATIACLFIWPLLVKLGSALDVTVARELLGLGRNRQLSAEVHRLGQARALAVESAASERRRIERDLHDGLQPRLVSLALELGLAKARFERNPAAALALLDQAHEEAKTAIKDLRSLVRGIHPSVLDERGLDAALSALVASCAVPVRVEVDLDQRPDQAREAVVYFVAAEAITNVTKHAAASRASVTITAAGEVLHLLVEDDGQGGARIEPGGGLAGLAARVAAVDGTFIVTSPQGGPTRIEVAVPCGQ
jgi:signal transduction histidine kinase